VKNIYVCFFADGRLWDNTPLVAAYPTGFSYFRPFRYRDAWIHDALRTEIDNELQRSALVDSSATLGMRFLSPDYKWLVLPVRKVQLTFIDCLPENYSVYLKMGPMINFAGVEDLRSICTEIPLEERQSDSEQTLFFRSSAVVSSAYCETSTDENHAWARYCDLVAKDQTMPIHEQARNCVFLRLASLTNGESVKTKAIHQSRRMGERYGAYLQEGKTYELVLLHRVPALIGLHETAEFSPVSYESATGNLKPSPAEEDYSANYQTHVVTVSAVTPSAAWEELVVKLPKGPIETPQTKKKIHTANLHIPARVSRSLWYRFRMVYVWVILLWLALTFLAAIDGIADGALSTPLLLVYAVVSGLAAILVAVVKVKA
jgi:hypothetical protein